MIDLIIDLLGNLVVFFVFLFTGYYIKYLYNLVRNTSEQSWRCNFYYGFFIWNILFFLPALLIGLFTSFLSLFMIVAFSISIAIIVLGTIIAIYRKEIPFLTITIAHLKKSIKNISKVESLLLIYAIINLSTFFTLGLIHILIAWDETQLWLPYARLFFENNGIPETEEILMGYTTYHPIVSLIYSVPFFVFGNINSFFRLIPFSYFLVLLLLIYDLAVEYGNKTVGLVAVTSFTSLPIIHYYMRSNTFYADMQTLFFLTFAVFNLLKALKENKITYIVFSGIAIGVTVLCKFQGLAVFVITFGIILFFVKHKIRMILSGLAGCALMAVTIIAATKIFALNDILGILQMYIASLVLFSIILLTNYLYKEDTQMYSFNQIFLFFLTMTAIGLTALTWYWRSYMLTGNFFYPQGGNEWFTEIITQAWFASGLYNKAFDVISAVTLPFLLLSYGGPLLLFKIYGLKQVISQKNRFKIAFLAWIFWYQFVWIAIFGMQNIRYNIYITPALSILIGFGFDNIQQRYDLDVPSSLMLPFFAALISLSMGYPWLPVYMGPLTPYLYPFFIHLQILAANIGYSLIAAGISYYLIKRYALNKVLKVRILKRQLTIQEHKVVLLFIGFICFNLLFSVYIPILQTSGWIAYRERYPMSQYQIVYNKILETTDDDDFILSFYTPGIYYSTGRKVLSMGFYTDMRLNRLKPLFNTGNMTFVLEYLKTLKIKDIVILTPRNQLYGWYYEVTNFAYFLKALRNNRLFTPVLESDKFINNIYSPTQNTSVYYGIFAVELENDRTVELLGNTKVDRPVLLGYNKTLGLTLYYDFCMLNLTQSFSLNISFQYTVGLQYKSYSLSYNDSKTVIYSPDTLWGKFSIFEAIPSELIKEFPKKNLIYVNISISEIKIKVLDLYKSLFIRIMPNFDTNIISWNNIKNLWIIPQNSSYLFESVYEAP